MARREIAHHTPVSIQPAAKLPYQYLNVGLIHDVKDGNNASIATIDIIRQSPILPDTTGYEAVVQRLTVPVCSIPAFVAALQVGSQFSENKMIYSFTTAYGGFASPQKNVEWIPQTSYYSEPTGTVQYALQSDKFYYHAYNITCVFDMFNTAIQTSLAELNALVALPAEFIEIQLYFDPIVEKPALFIPATCVDIELYFNNQTAAIFSGWRYTTIAKNSPTGQDNLFDIFSTKSNTDINGDILIYPETFNYNYLSPVQTIQIRSTLPIIYENTMPININYGETAIIPNTNQSYPASQNILTDFAIDSSMISSEGSYFVYNKTDSTRFISFSGGKSIQNFNLSVYWTDNSNASWPMYLLPGTTISIKMIFVPCR